MRIFKEDGPNEVTCDICQKEQVKAESLSEWARSGRSTGWIVASHSPVPNNGLDCCPKCKANLMEKMNPIIDSIHIEGSAKNIILGKFFKMVIDEIMFGGPDGMD